LNAFSTDWILCSSAQFVHLTTRIFIRLEFSMPGTLKSTVYTLLLMGSGDHSGNE